MDEQTSGQHFMGLEGKKDEPIKDLSRLKSEVNGFQLTVFLLLKDTRGFCGIERLQSVFEHLSCLFSKVRDPFHLFPLFSFQKRILKLTRRTEPQLTRWAEYRGHRQARTFAGKQEVQILDRKLCYAATSPVKLLSLASNSPRVGSSSFFIVSPSAHQL